MNKTSGLYSQTLKNSKYNFFNKPKKTPKCFNLVKKSIKALVCAFTISALQFSSAAAGSDGTVIFSADAFTVNYGFVELPKQVNITQGETLRDVVFKALDQSEVNYGESMGDSVIALAADSAWFEVVDSIQSVLTEKNITNNKQFAYEGWLSQHDFTETSGWYAIVNNQLVTVPFENFLISSNDVIRLVFSVYGNGADLNVQTTPNVETGVESPILESTNRDTLYRAIATYSAGSDFEIDDYIMEIAINSNAKQTELDEATELINGNLDFIDPDEDSDFLEDPDDDDDDIDIDDDDDDNIPQETLPPETQVPSETTNNGSGNPDLPYIPDDGQGSGNLPKEPSAPTGVSIEPILSFAVLSGIAALVFRKKR